MGEGLINLPPRPMPEGKSAGVQVTVAVTEPILQGPVLGPRYYYP